MSASRTRNLPRFDEVEGLSPLVDFYQPSAESSDLPELSESLENPEVAKVAEFSDPAEPMMPELGVTEEPLDDVDAPDEQDPYQEDMSRALEKLSSAVDEFEQSAAQNIAFAIHTMIGDVFPKLSEKFLTDEFVLHVSNLIKFAPPVAKIRAAPPVAQQLITASKSVENWPASWVVEPLATMESVRVEVLWDQGGLTYDYPEVLKTCLGELSEHVSQSEEG
ncbi:MAG: hypothetical protein ABJG15_01395 [Hyphomonadaceae bacterium]